jgi:type I restriction enzyme S subunit
MKNEWSYKKLEEVCDILDSLRKPISKKNRKAGPYPYYGASKIVDWIDDYIFNEKLVLVGEDGAKWGSGENSSFIADGKYWVNNHAHVIRPKAIILHEWITYYLNFSDLNYLVTGVTVPKLNQAKLKSINLPLPDISEQKSIVEKLDFCMEQIDKAIQNVEQNIKNAEKLLKSQLNEIFSQKAGEWIEEKLGNCLKLKSGEGLTSKNMNQNGNYDVYGGNGVVGKHDMFNMQGSQVIIGRVGAHCGNVRIVNEKIWLTDNAFKVSEFFYDFDKLFLTYLLNFKNLRNFARQSAQPVISNSSMKDVTLCFPKNIELQKSIASQFEELKSKIKVLEFRYRQELIALDDLKKSILEKAFNGEL